MAGRTVFVLVALAACADSPDAAPTAPIVHHGDVLIASAADAAVLADVDELDGALVIDAADLTALELPQLARVHGDVEVRAFGAQYVVMSSLVAVDGALVTGGAWPDAQSLQVVGGALDLRLSIRLERPSPPPPLLPALQSVGGDLSLLVSPAGLAALNYELQSLTTVQGGINLLGHFAFAAPALTRASYVRASGNLESQNELVAIRLPALTSIGGLVLAGISISTLELPALRTAAFIWISGCKNLCNSVGRSLQYSTGAYGLVMDNKDC